MTVSLPKHILLMVSIGLGIGIVSIVICHAFDAFSISLPERIIGGGAIGAGLVLAIVLTNKSIRRGGCQWLLKRP